MKKSNNLRAWRETAELTQSQAAEKLGLSHTTLSRHEVGSRLPSPEIAERYATLYRVCGWDLFLDLVMARRQMNKVPNRMKELRKGMNLTSAEAGKLVSLTEAHNDCYERGGVPTVLRLKRYATLYKVTDAELYIELPNHTPGG